MSLDPNVQAALVGNLGLIVVALLQLKSHHQQNKIKNKVDQTHHQVAVNNHKSDTPTLLDKLDDLTGAVAAVTERQDRHEELHRIERLFRNNS